MTTTDDLDKLVHAVAIGAIPHAYNGKCPDPLSGTKGRDPACAACQIILRTEIEIFGASPEVATNQYNQPEWAHIQAEFDHCEACYHNRCVDIVHRLWYSADIDSQLDNPGSAIILRDIAAEAWHMQQELVALRHALTIIPQRQRPHQAGEAYADWQRRQKYK